MPESGQQLTMTADGSMILDHPAICLLTLDLLANCVLGLKLSDQHVQQYEGLFRHFEGGLVPPAWDLPFTPYGKGLRARRQIAARVKQMLSSPQCSGPLARLREEFGANSPEAVNNTINLLFAGFDSTSSTIAYTTWLLAKHPDALEEHPGGKYG